MKTRSLVLSITAILVVLGVIFSAGCASGQADVEAAQKAADVLYLPYTKTWSSSSAQLASNVTTATISTASTKVESLKDGTKQKPSLQKMVSTAKVMYANQLKATDEITLLYNNGSFFVVSEETSSTLNTAKTALRKVTNPDRHKSLETSLTACIDEYDAQNAASAVLQKIAAPGTATQQLVATAQAAISSCKSSIAKSILQTKLAQYQKANAPVKVNLIGTLSDAKYEALNLFFSNFSEVVFTEYDHNNYDIDKLITFSIWHSYRNNGATHSGGSAQYDEQVSAEKVASDLQRYFGITDYSNHSIHYTEHGSSMSGSHDYPFSNGAYHFAGADGAPLTWSQVITLYDNGDGTFSAKLQDYSTQVLSADYIYKRQKYWKVGSDTSTNDVWGGYERGGQWTATIKPSTFNGKDTYILLSCHPVY